MITETSNIRDEKGTAGWVLYDGRCGFCSAGARRAARVLTSLGFGLAPLQAPWVMEKLGSRTDAPPPEMGLLTADGRVLAGVDAYVYVAEQLWWARPLARLARFGPIDRLLRRAYRWIAAHRQRISAVCRLRPDLPIEKEVAHDRRLLH